jgi:hypothetical protein
MLGTASPPEICDRWGGRWEAIIDSGERRPKRRMLIVVGWIIALGFSAVLIAVHDIKRNATILENVMKKKLTKAGRGATL